MSEAWKYQIRVDVDETMAERIRKGTGDTALAPLHDVLAKYRAAPVCQYDAFAGYCAEAEREGIDQYPLYAWTKATIENPAKKAKYLKSFTLYVEGDQVYDKAIADGLERDLQPFVENGQILKLYKYDSNPANNPQPPASMRG